VLLTGATGFVGPHVAEAFRREGAVVRALVRSAARAADLHDVEVVSGSLEDAASLERACAGVDVVVHMAAVLHARTDAEYHAVNAAGTQRLLDAMRRVDPAPRRLVYLSSLAACGPAIEGRGVTAQDPPRPLTAYGRSKLEGERVVLAAKDGTEVVIVRAPAVYGPRDTDLFHFFRLARRGIIPVPTGPDRPLQLVHAQDLARGLVRAAFAPGATGVYHVAEPRGYSWQQVGKLVGDAVGRRVRVIRIPAGLLSALAAVSETAAGMVGGSSIFNRDKARELLAPGWLCETESARADLGYEAAIPLAEGLRSTAQWYREHGWL